MQVRVTFAVNVGDTYGKSPALSPYFLETAFCVLEYMSKLDANMTLSYLQNYYEVEEKRVFWKSDIGSSMLGFV